MEREEMIRLVTASQSGDSDALNSLFNEFYNDVYYFAYKTVKDEESACDITQESFIEIINSIGALQEPAAFVKWMKQITYHQCTRYFKKKKDVLVEEDEDGNTIFDIVAEDRTEFIPDEVLDQQDFRHTILAMLDELSEEQRAATLLYYYDELSVKQIAEIQGVPEGTIKSRLNYARKSIKNFVESYEKKNNVKLHSFAFFPFMFWLLKCAAEESGAVAAGNVGTVATGISAATGVVMNASATSSAAVVATTATTATTSTSAVAAGTGTVAKIVSLSLAAKVIAVIAAGAIVAGGVGIVVSNSLNADGSSPTTSCIEQPVASMSADATNSFSAATTQPTESTTVPVVQPTAYTQPTESTEPTAAPTDSLPTEPIHVHAWVDASCTTPKTCGVCGEIEGKALGHIWQEATCAAPKTCVTCDETEGVELDHVWDDGVVLKEATEDTDGEILYTCILCAQAESQSIPFAEHEHDYTDVVVTNPTCTENGFTTYTCHCGDHYAADETAAFGHDYSSSVTEPTCMEQGRTTYTCTVCQDTYTDTVVAAWGIAGATGLL